MWYITNKWLQMDTVGMGFDIATHKDDINDQRRAKIVIGAEGFIKHAWASCLDSYRRTEYNIR